MAHLILLVIGQGHHAQGEHLVHFGCVVEVGGALRRDLRVIVENDGRAEQHVTLGAVADQHGKIADVAYRRSRHREVFRRVEKRDELAAGDGENGMRREQGARAKQSRDHADLDSNGVVLVTSTVSLIRPVREYFSGNRDGSGYFVLGAA